MDPDMELLEEELYDAAVRSLIVHPSDASRVIVVYDDDSTDLAVWDGEQWTFPLPSYENQAE